MGPMMAAMGASMLLWTLLGLVLLIVAVAMAGFRRLIGRSEATIERPTSPTVTGKSLLDDPDSADSTRASDADREHTVSALQTHMTAGRLTTDEFDQRAQQCYTGNTLGDLRHLLTDLPRSR